MAKQSMTTTFTKATIDVENDTIIENPKKDEVNFYKLSDFLKKWDKVEGINITFKKDEEIKSEDGEDE